MVLPNPCSFRFLRWLIKDVEDVEREFVIPGAFYFTNRSLDPLLYVLIEDLNNCASPPVASIEGWVALRSGPRSELGHRGGFASLASVLFMQDWKT